MFYEMLDVIDDNHICLPLQGKTVLSARFDLDNLGYTRLVIVFTDDTRLEALEEGQAGKFSVTV